MRPRLFISALVASFAFALFAQDQPAEPRKYVPAQVRLAAAKNVYLRNAGGTDIPFNVIQAGIESWARYTIVDTPEKSDLIIEVLSPEESKKETSVGAKVDTKGGTAGPNTSATADFAPIQIVKMTVMDARTRVVLFSATERPKNAWKEKARTDSQIECAQKLLTAFRNRVEPPQAAQPDAAPKPN